MGIAITMLYLAHREGTPVDVIAREVNVPAHWLQERFEAARLCCEHQVTFRRRR